MDNDKYVEYFYDSDEGIAWGPPTLREIKSILKKPSCKPRRRHTIDTALNSIDKINYSYDSDGKRDSIIDVCDHLNESENNKSKDSKDSSGIIYEIDYNSESFSGSSEIWKCMHDQELQSYYNSVVSQEKGTNVSCEICEQENNSFGYASIQELNIKDSTKSDEGKKSISAQLNKNNLSISDMVPPTSNDVNESCNKSFQENISFESVSVQEFNFCDASKKSLKNIDTVHCDNMSSTFGSKNKDNESCQLTEHENTRFVLAPVQEVNINDSSLKSLKNDNSSEQISAQELSIKSNTFSKYNKYTDKSSNSTRENLVRQALNKTENPIEDFYQTLVKSSFLDKGDRSKVDNTDFEISELSYNSGNTSPAISIPEIDVHQFSEDSDCLLDNTFDRITSILNQTKDTSLLNVMENQENDNKEPDDCESSMGSFEDEQCNEKRVIQDHIGTETPNHKVKSCIPVIKNSGPPIVQISSLPVKNINTDFRVPHTPHKTKGNKYKPNIKDIVSPVRMYINYSPISVQKHNVTSKDCNLPLVSNKCVTRNNENKSTLPKIVYKPSQTKIIEQGKKLQLPGSIEKHVKSATTIKHARVLTSRTSPFEDKTLIDVADLTNTSSVYTDPGANISVLQTNTALK